MLVLAFVWQVYGELSPCNVPIGSWSYSSCQASGVQSSGGNIRAGELWIKDCVFKGYSGYSYGGVCRVDKGKVTVSGTSFTGCYAKGASCFFGNGVITITKCDFTENLGPSGDPPSSNWGSVKWGYGCVGLITASDTTATITECTFDKNENGCLGQGKPRDKNGKMNVTVKHCIFTDNHFNPAQSSVVAAGGNCYIESGTHDFENCTFSASEDPKEGWAFYVNAVVSTPTIRLTECYFQGIESTSATIFAKNGKFEMKTLVTFTGNSIHIKRGTETGSLSVTASGCVQFSNAVEDAVVGVTITAEDGVVWDQGQLCGGGWPPSEVVTSVPDPEETSEIGPDPEEPSTGGSGGSEGGGSIDESDDPEPKPDPDPAQGKKLTGGEIAAIVIVLLIVIVVVVLLLFFLVFRRRYGRGSDSLSGDATSEVTATDEEVTGTEAVASHYGTQFGLWDSEVPPSDVNAKNDSE